MADTSSISSKEMSKSNVHGVDIVVAKEVSGQVSIILPVQIPNWFLPC